MIKPNFKLFYIATLVSVISFLPIRVITLKPDACCSDINFNTTDNCVCQGCHSAFSYAKFEYLIQCLIDQRYVGLYDFIGTMLMLFVRQKVGSGRFRVSVIYTAGSKIGKIYAHIFPKFYFLTELYLNKSEITSIQRNAFNPCHVISAIDLSFNNLRYINLNTFNDCSLISLKLNDNRILNLDGASYYRRVYFALQITLDGNPQMQCTCPLFELLCYLATFKMSLRQSYILHHKKGHNFKAALNTTTCTLRSKGQKTDESSSNDDLTEGQCINPLRNLIAYSSLYCDSTTPNFQSVAKKMPTQLSNQATKMGYIEVWYPECNDNTKQSTTPINYCPKGSSSLSRPLTHIPSVFLEYYIMATQNEGSSLDKLTINGLKQMTSAIERGIKQMEGLYPQVVVARAPAKENRAEEVIYDFRVILSSALPNYDRASRGYIDRFYDDSHDYAYDSARSKVSVIDGTVMDADSLEIHDSEQGEGEKGAVMKTAELIRDGADEENSVIDFNVYPIVYEDESLMEKEVRDAIDNMFPSFGPETFYPLLMTFCLALVTSLTICAIHHIWFVRYAQKLESGSVPQLKAPICIPKKPNNTLR